MPKKRTARKCKIQALLPFIKRAMRRASQRWRPIIETRNKARRPYRGPNKRLKFEYQCNICKGYFPRKKVQVDHIIPVGPFTKLSDVQGFLTRLFCPASNLQLLCIECHRDK